MITIAIVEDNFDYAFVLAGYLEHTNHFHVVAVHHTSPEALGALSRNPVDIAIVDIHLQDKGGVELLQQLRKVGACVNTRYLVLTVGEDDETVFRALYAGANGYILKNAPLERIADALFEISNGGAPMSAFISGKLLKFFCSRYKAANDVHLLSEREKEILQCISRGMLYKEIAAELSIQRETVKKHLSKIYEKLEVQNKIEAINKFYGK